MKLLIHSQTSTVAPLKFGNGKVIASHTLLGMWLLIYAEIQLIHVSKGAPGNVLLPNGAKPLPESILTYPR